MIECFVIKIFALLLSALYFGVSATFAFRLWKSKVKPIKIFFYSLGWVFLLVHIVLNGNMTVEDSQ
jgi:drug/metabolite transporter (DMT)-like permease